MSHDIVTEMMNHIRPFAEPNQLNVVIYRVMEYDRLMLEAHIYRANNSIEVVKRDCCKRVDPFPIFTLDGMKAYLAGPTTNIVADDMICMTYQGVREVPLEILKTPEELSESYTYDWFDVDVEIEGNNEYIQTMHRLAEYAWNVLKRV